MYILIWIKQIWGGTFTEPFLKVSHLCRWTWCQIWTLFLLLQTFFVEPLKFLSLKLFEPPTMTKCSSFPLLSTIKSALSPKGTVLSGLGGADSQTGQHSPSGITIFSQLITSSHCISSQRTWPLSHTQIRHGSGFQMSLLVYTWPSAVQLTSSPAANRGQRNTQSVEFKA